MSDAPAQTHEPAASSSEDAPTTGDPQADARAEALAQIRALADAVKREVGRVFIGSDQVIEALLIALVAGGHVLLEGVPGVAKTTLVRAFARTLSVSFSRVQFTPDLLPSDITGVYIPNLQTQEFILRRGPIFASVVLGDEINRAPAKTQSALLEAMQEHQVTIEGETHPLPDPFLVLATQNPLEQEGVYMLPEAQLDRFLLKVFIGYPSPEQELRVLKTHQRARAEVEARMTPEDIAAVRQFVDTSVHCSDEMMRYIISLARFTRDHQHVALGASPRAALSLLKASKARAALRGRDYVLPDDVRALAPEVFAHRVILSAEAELSGASANEIVRQALAKVRYSPAR